MLFADDIVLPDETTSGINAKLEASREALPWKGFWISTSKPDYVECNFSGSKSMSVDRVTL